MHMANDDVTLPVLEATHADPEPDETCSPKNYVTNEQAAIVAEMRRLGDRAKAIRGLLEAVENSSEKQTLEAELVALRRQREHLVTLREKAIERKMVMLGHEPPDPLL